MGEVLWTGRAVEEERIVAVGGVARSEKVDGIGGFVVKGLEEDTTVAKVVAAVRELMISCALVSFFGCL